MILWMRKEIQSVLYNPRYGWGGLEKYEKVKLIEQEIKEKVL